MPPIPQYSRSRRPKPEQPVFLSCRARLMSQIMPWADREQAHRGDLRCAWQDFVRDAFPRDERLLVAAIIGMRDPLSQRLHRCFEPQSVFESLLQYDLELCQCEFGNVQLMNWQAGYLEIKAQRGLDAAFLQFFEQVKLEHELACARAFRTREPRRHRRSYGG